MLWFIVLITVMSNGDVYSDVRPATSPEFNSEETCKQIGGILVVQEQLKIADGGKVYFVCDSFSKETFQKALGSGSNL